MVDRYIIPTTWNNIGAGLYGDVGPLRYKAYVIAGLDVFGTEPLEAGSWIRNARTGEFGPARTWAGVVNLNVDVGPATFGGSFYGGNAGQGYRTTTGVPVSPTVLLGEVHALVAWKGLPARAILSWGSLSEAGTVSEVLGKAPEEYIGSRAWGGYVEAGYDVLTLAGSSMSLSPFLRFEALNPQAAVEGLGVLNPMLRPAGHHHRHRLQAHPAGGGEGRLAAGHQHGLPDPAAVGPGRGLRVLRTSMRTGLVIAVAATSCGRTRARAATRPTRSAPSSQRRTASTRTTCSSPTRWRGRLDDLSRARIPERMVTFYAAPQGRRGPRLRGAAVPRGADQAGDACSWPSSPTGRFAELQVLSFLEPPEYRPSDRWLAQFAGKGTTTGWRWATTSPHLRLHALGARRRRAVALAAPGAPDGPGGREGPMRFLVQPTPAVLERARPPVRAFLAFVARS